MKLKKRPVRPMWLVLLTLMVGVFMVGAIVALTGHYVFHLVLLAPVLMGIAGGVFGWLLANRLNWYQRRTLRIIGAIFALVIYLCYHLIAYGLFTHLVESVTVIEYINLMLERGTTISRRSNPLFSLSGSAIWIYWGIESIIAMGIGGQIAYLVEKSYDEKIQSP